MVDHVVWVHRAPSGCWEIVQEASTEPPSFHRRFSLADKENRVAHLQAWIVCDDLPLIDWEMISKVVGLVIAL